MYTFFPLVTHSAIIHGHTDTRTLFRIPGMLKLTGYPIPGITLVPPPAEAFHEAIIRRPRREGTKRGRHPLDGSKVPHRMKGSSPPLPDSGPSTFLQAFLQASGSEPRRSFPEGVRGSSSTSTTSRGALNRAIRSEAKSRSSCTVGAGRSGSGIT